MRLLTEQDRIDFNTALAVIMLLADNIARDMSKLVEMT